MTGAAGHAPRDDDVRRVAQWNPTAFGFATLPFILGGAVAVGWIDQAPTTPTQASLAATLIGGFAWLTWRIVSVRVVVTPGELDVRGVLRHRRFRWSEVTGLEWEKPRWLRVVFFRFSAQRVRVSLASGHALAPLALYGTIEYEKINRVVGAARRNVQLLGKHA